MSKRLQEMVADTLDKIAEACVDVADRFDGCDGKLQRCTKGSLNVRAPAHASRLVYRCAVRQSTPSEQGHCRHRLSFRWMSSPLWLCSLPCQCVFIIGALANADRLHALLGDAVRFVRYLFNRVGGMKKFFANAFAYRRRPNGTLNLSFR